MTTETIPPRVLAARHAARRRIRLIRIRRTVAVASLAAFIALFAGIYVQMALGSDPALGRKALASTTANTAHKVAHRQKAAVSSGSSGSASTSSQPPAAVTSQPPVAATSQPAVAAASQPSAVTTSQS